MFHFTYLQSIVIGLLQGVTELFPISSLGHAVLLPAWLGGSWKIFAASDQYLLVTIAFHLASALALFLVFSKRWFRIISTTLTSLRRGEFVGSGIQLLARLVIGTIPVAILGKLFSDSLQKSFGAPLRAGIFLAVNGLILFGVERLTRRRHSHVHSTDPDAAIVERVSLGQSFLVGVSQSLALFPGISRFGISMTGGMMRGLNRAVASDFAFLLAFPAILGAGLLKAPKLLAAGAIAPDSVGPLLVGIGTAFVATYISVTFLVRWFKSHTLNGFATYCLIVGGLSIIRFGLFS